MLALIVVGVVALTAVLAVITHRREIEAARAGRPRVAAPTFEATQTELWRRAANSSSGVGTTGGG
ncbi:MAG: hypothetical protein AAFZ07_27885 [Actinomycetota bacterium]